MNMTDKKNLFNENKRRLLLVVDDEFVNREILGEILKQEYDVLFAENGAEAMELIRKNREALSLILLDLMMPVMDGKDVLNRVTTDADLSHIPVIVLTSDQESEVECLSLGAIDFIPKPYPQVDVILARVHRTIELSEDRRIIQETERDSLTGLYTKEYFFRYAQQFDQFHKNTDTDAIVIDVNHFHIINERFGKVYGDVVLRQIGEKIRSIVWQDGGIVSRKEADTFLVYCPHREDYEEILERISSGFNDEENGRSRIHLRMGVYSKTDKSLDIEQRFDRAKIAADMVHGSFTKTIGIYDDKLNQQELFEEQLIEEFDAALETGQFQVYFQPKFDIRPNKPVLAGAEALIRWRHPELGLINPGVFIPLFEENGLIQKVDRFVWRESARQIREWKDRLGFSVPVSVNVSRVDLNDPNIVNEMQSIIDSNGLTTGDLYLEITESAYTQNSVQIIEVVKKLRDSGFHIEMDDFGTGYSSLNMISTLPIDALKLDMQFVRNAFTENGNTRMMEIIIDLADFLGVPSIAEGVETEEQLKALRMMGCDLVQGYYFSKPVPAEEFEHFLTEGKIAHAELDAFQKAEKEAAEAKLAAGIVSMRQTKEQKAQETESREYTQREKQKSSGIPMRIMETVFAILAVLAAVALLYVDTTVNRVYKSSVDAGDRLNSAEIAAFNMEAGSDYLTDRVRSFAVNGDMIYLQDFFEEVEVTRRRDQALADLEVLMDGSDNSAYEHLSTALQLSNELIDRENKSMRLRLNADGAAEADIPAALRAVELSEEELALTREEQIDLAVSLVFDDIYRGYKNKIKENVSLCTENLLQHARTSYQQVSERFMRLLRLQTVLTVVLLVIVLGLVLFIRTQVRDPLTRLVDNIRTQRPDKPAGAEELRYVSRAYNDFLADSQKLQTELTYEAMHDDLTGLFNRRAYDLLIRSIDTSHIALLLFDIDQFRKFNDIYGHDMGDRILTRVADALKGHFRSVDIVCRIGGDEFAVIMTRMNSSMHQLVRNKFMLINRELQTVQDDIPGISLCMGAAFSDRQDPQGDILKDADTALYRAKNAGRRNCEFF